MLKLLIIVPHFNNPEKLFRCISSIKDNIINSSQKFNFTIIIIDDCSDDKSMIALEKIIYFSGVELIKLPKNGGVSNARNIGLNYGINNEFDYVSFVDCDDHLTCKVYLNEFENHDLTIFQTVETIDNYVNYFEYTDYILKINHNLHTCLKKLLVAYSETPNKVPALTTCWGKIYNLKIIEKKKIFFNIKMHTFEDVDFLLRYIYYINKINFIEKFFYAHTNSKFQQSASFGYGRSINEMFSFLLAARSLQKLFIKYNWLSYFNKHHFLACYYSIALIRISNNRNSLSDKIEFYYFIKRRIKKKYMKNCFHNYNPVLAGGRQLIKILIKLNQPLILSVILMSIAKKRYQA